MTIAHEFNHVLQFTYDVLQDPWMDESTATWMENEVFPNVDDYFNYVRGWARESRMPLTSAGFPKLYGSAVWLQWLAERHGARIVRSAWQRTQKIEPAGFSVRVFNSAIKEHVALQLRPLVRPLRRQHRGVAGRTAASPRRSGSRGCSAADTSCPRRPVQRRIHHTGYQLLRVPVPDGQSAGAAPRRVGQARHAGGGRPGRPRSEGGAAGTVTRLRFLKNGGKRVVTLGRPGRFRRITAVFVNADARQNGFGPFGWRYTRDRVPFRARIAHPAAQSACSRTVTSFHSPSRRPCRSWVPTVRQPQALKEGEAAAVRREDLRDELVGAAARAWSASQPSSARPAPRRRASRST